MQIDHAQEQCRRPDCHCSVPNGDAYCGEQCRNATEGASLREAAGRSCACGHGECTADRDERAMQ